MGTTSAVTACKCAHSGHVTRYGTPGATRLVVVNTWRTTRLGATTTAAEKGKNKPASTGIRTLDLLLTKQMLCQLSYRGELCA